MTTTALVERLKAEDQDFEWYPTTDEIIAAMVKDLKAIQYRTFDEDGELKKPSSRWHNSVRMYEYDSLLDIGAGNGKVLIKLRYEAAEVDSNGERMERRFCWFKDLYAIEKSPILCEQLDDDIKIVGTELFEQSLLSKQVNVIFSNPPYSEFEEWVVKILREAAAQLVYLVIPQRWQDSHRIQSLLKYREAEAHVVGSFDFENAERQARAKVHLIRIELAKQKDDAFERFFNEAFGAPRSKFPRPADDDKEKPEAKEPDKSAFEQLVVGPTYPEAMVNLYLGELAKIEANYKAAAQLDPDLLREFDISWARMMGCLKQRLSGLKNVYWSELFGRLNAITDRLTSKKRQCLMNALQKHAEIDFTLSNIHVVILWMIKHANQFLDEQLIETFEEMVEAANVRCYKSNQRVFEKDAWRFREAKHTHIALDYRIVCHRIGGIRSDYGGRRGLEERAVMFLGDLLTVGRNLGFMCDTADSRLHAASYHHNTAWNSGTKHEFYCTRAGRRELFYDAKAFLNSNVHIRLNQKFALALNVEYGRLKGWLKSGAEAAEELQDPEAAKWFNTTLRLGPANVPMLAASTDDDPFAALEELAV